MPVDTASELRFGVANEELTGLAGLALAAGLVKDLGLAEALARRVRLKQRRSRCRDEPAAIAAASRHTTASTNAWTGLYLEGPCATFAARASGSRKEHHLGRIKS